MENCCYIKVNSPFRRGLIMIHKNVQYLHIGLVPFPYPMRNTDEKCEMVKHCGLLTRQMKLSGVCIVQPMNDGLMRVIGQTYVCTAIELNHAVDMIGNTTTNHAHTQSNIIVFLTVCEQFLLYWKIKQYFY